jgi:hypothetical protein
VNKMPATAATNFKNSMNLLVELLLSKVCCFRLFDDCSCFSDFRLSCHVGSILCPLHQAQREQSRKLIQRRLVPASSMPTPRSNSGLIFPVLRTTSIDSLLPPQVRYLGLMENLRVRRAGYCNRQVYEVFAKRYKVCSRDLTASHCCFSPKPYPYGNFQLMLEFCFG